MFTSLSKLVLCCVCVATATIMTGCGDVTVFPDTGVAGPTTNQVPVGTIQGSNYGGHAPIVGSHIYLLQPGTTGYGSLTKGLLTANYAGSYATTQNSNDQFVGSADSAGKPYYYETTDTTGAFNLTGDYTCTVSQPVFIVGYGGNPSYQGTATQNVSSISTEETYNNGSTAVYLTYVTTTQLFYVGESVTISGSAGGAGGFNQTGTVLASGYHSDGSAAPLSTTSFTILVPYNSTLTAATGNYAPYAYGGGSVIVTGTPTFNPAAVNIAMLGLCPSSGNFSTGASALKYVYMNEISTTAFAYAMNQYANWSMDDQHGNDEFHIGAPNTVQAQVGIQNAAINAGNLYDIQGSSGVSTVFAGEGHLARTTTPGGNGTVPQTTLDTLGNILAACVDSQNTYRAGSGVQSSQCLTLDRYAQDNGVYDTTATTHIAFNIAQAALNIAHYPQGAGTATTTGQSGGNGYGGTQTVTAGTTTSARAFTTNLFNLPTGNVPFTPNLAAAPNDFSIAIQWNTGASSNDVEIDASGNAWAAASGGTLSQITPSGTVTAYTGTLSTAATLGVAIDGVNGNIWVPGATGVYKYTAGTAAGTLIGAGQAAAGIALDGSLNQYLANLGDTGGLSSIAKQGSTGVAAGGNFPVLSGTTVNTAGACANGVGWTALDTSNNLWTATSNNFFNVYPYVCRFDSLGNLRYSLSLPSAGSSQAGGFGFPRGLATDAGNNAWFTDKNSDRLYKVAVNTTTANSGYTYLQLPGVLSAPRGLAIDGANTIWVASTGDLGATTGPKYATGLAQFTNADTAITPSYITGAAYTTTPTASLGNAAIDPSGDLWAVQTPVQGSGVTPTMVYEYIGLAAPTVTPIAAAKAGSQVGVRP